MNIISFYFYDFYCFEDCEWFRVNDFKVAEVFTGTQGKLVPLKETIKGFKAILNGEYDHIPEVAFYMVGPIEEVAQKAERLAAERASS